MLLSPDDPRAVALVTAIRAGQVGDLERQLTADPALATVRIDGSRTLLHVAADWPGHIPNGAAVVATLVGAGAEVDAPFVGRHAETPLHWAASSDDIAVLDALLDAGANLEAPGSVINGGTALADAVAFGQWAAARRLVERGAQTELWQAAALGLSDRVAAAFTGAIQPSAHEVTNAFWCACHGGQQSTAAYLLGQGADRDWVGHDLLTPLGAAIRHGATEVVTWLRELGARES